MSEIRVEGCGCVANAMVYGLYESIRRAKFPMATDTDMLNFDMTKGIKALAQSGRGEGHDQWLTGVIVQFDLTFTNKAWVEAERYHFLDFVSSQSTMHRITKFDLDNAFNEHTDKRIIEIVKEKAREYNELCDAFNGGLVPQSVEFLADLEERRKEKYLEVLYSNPAGFRLTAGMTTNYRQLKTIYCQRKNHRLPEWREFCKWIETLPMSELITGKDKERFNTQSRINNPYRMKQLIDFKGLEVDGYIYPTDIDGLIEYKDSEYILFEVKYGSAEVPLGQKLAIQRMVDDFTKVGKQAVAFVCEHTVRDANKPVVAAWCKVREIYYGKEKQWRAPDNEITVREAVDSFQRYSKLVMQSKQREEMKEE